MAHTASLVCFISTVNGCNEKKEKPIKTDTSSGHITNLKQSILETFDTYGCHTADSKPVKQEVNGTAILPPLVFPAAAYCHGPLISYPIPLYYSKVLRVTF
jgi:hypothetical protein